MAFAAPPVAAIYARVKYPYNMNGPTQREIARRIKSGLSRQVAEIVDERCKLASALASVSSVVKVYPSDANFLLVKVTDADAIYKYLIERGIIVRNRTRVKGCENCLRVTVGTPAENRRVVEGFLAYERGDDNLTLSCDGERRAVVDRKTKETDIHIEVDLDRPGEADIATGLDFFDHMLEQIAYHGSIGLIVKCLGDTNVDEHHSMEDIAIALGDALITALGSKRGIERYGFVLPMDDCRAMVLIDLGGRAELRWNVDFTREYVGDTPTEMYRHFFHSLAVAMKANIHVEASGENNHHLVEGVFKAFARALKMAVRREPFSYQLPSSKGMI